MQKPLKHIGYYLCCLSFLVLLLHQLVPHHHHFEQLNEVHKLLHQESADGHHHHHDQWHHHQDAGEHEACDFSPQVKKQELASLALIIVTLKTVLFYQDEEPDWFTTDFQLVRTSFLNNSPFRGPPMPCLQMV